jgi:hypothetical protein
MALVVGLGASSEISVRPISELGMPKEMAVKAFLRTYLKNPYYDYKRTRYIARVAHLHGNESDVIVHLEDRYSCGSGGCTTLVLSPKGESAYRVVTSMTIVQLPIRVLETTICRRQKSGSSGSKRKPRTCGPRNPEKNSRTIDGCDGYQS